MDVKIFFQKCVKACDKLRSEAVPWLNYACLKASIAYRALKPKAAVFGRDLARRFRRTAGSLLSRKKREKKKSARHVFSAGLISAASLGIFALAASGIFVHSVNRPAWNNEDMEPVLVKVAPGTAGAKIPEVLDGAGIDVNKEFWRIALRLRGIDSLRSGVYEITPQDSAWSIMTKMNNHEAVLFRFRVPEGATYWEVLSLLGKAQGLAHDTAGMSAQEILSSIGAGESHLEGLFAPDTYSFHYGVSDVVVLQSAYNRQKKILEELWPQRSKLCLLKTPYEALILGSIIEREVGLTTDRYIVSGIFMNRLRLNMALQTDPSLIYGQGENYEGRITRRVLSHNNPYNTYLKPGLPPTPIGMPSRESIHAALHPAKTQYLYFINKDNGELVASRTLKEHNEAVNRYIRKKK